MANMYKYMAAKTVLHILRDGKKKTQRKVGRLSQLPCSMPVWLSRIDRVKRKEIQYQGQQLDGITGSVLRLVGTCFLLFH